MSNFVRHEPCPSPSCNSSDAFAIFDDGHGYCFSCGYHQRGTTTLEEVERTFIPKEEVNPNDFPYDASPAIPKEPYAWLKQYGITNEEIIRNHLSWSPSRQMLLFPHYGEQSEERQLLCWQGRYFPARKPKVYTSGYPDKHLLLHPNNDIGSDGRVVLVEDSVSAIKVSRYVTSSPLWGSNLSIQKARQLSRYFSHLTLWLDNDKIKEMVRFRDRYSFFFKKVDYIISEYDPKIHNDQEIQNFLKKS